MLRYAMAIVATRWNRHNELEIKYIAGEVHARSEEEAIGIALKFANGKYPQEDGWTIYTPNLYELKKECSCGI